MHVLHNHVGGIGLEGYAIVAIVDEGVLNRDAVGAIRVPAVGVLGNVCGFGESADENVAEDDICGVSDPVVVLRGVDQIEIGDYARV